MRGDWGFVLSVPFVPRFYAVLQNYAKYVDPPLGWGHVIFMPKYGHCDVNQVTWAKYSMLIGRENFCCAVIGRYPVEPYVLLTRAAKRFPWRETFCFDVGQSDQRIEYRSSDSSRPRALKRLGFRRDLPNTLWNVNFATRKKVSCDVECWLLYEATAS